MLHIILVILKIIGIIVAVLLLLFLVAVLSILFVPLRYRIEGTKEKAELSAKGKLSWFFHCIRLRASYENGTTEAELRILFFRKKLFPVEIKETSSKRKRRKKGSSFDEPEDEIDDDFLDIPEDNYVPSVEAKMEEPPREDANRDKSQLVESKNEESKNEKFPYEESKDKEFQRENLQHETLPISESFESKEDSETEKNLREEGGKPSKTRFRIKKKLQEVKEKFIEIKKKIKRFFYNLKEIWKKGGNLKSRVQNTLRMLKEDEVKAVLARFKAHGLYLWKHTKPDRIEGEVHYGFEDPSITGQLTGILYLLLPSSCYKVRLEPDFKNIICEGRLIIIGHIRAYHLLRVMWKIYRDKEFRKLLKRVKA